MKKGYFGDFGGCFVPELLMPPLMELEQAMASILPSEAFQRELSGLLFDYAGRETPVTFCPTLSRELGFELWLKREDLLHTGAHKINNVLGQALLAKKMGKTSMKKLLERGGDVQVFMQNIVDYNTADRWETWLNQARSYGYYS